MTQKEATRLNLNQKESACLDWSKALELGNEDAMKKSKKIAIRVIR